MSIIFALYPYKLLRVSTSVVSQGPGPGVEIKQYFLVVHRTNYKFVIEKGRANVEMVLHIDTTKYMYMYVI